MSVPGVTKSYKTYYGWELDTVPKGAVAWLVTWSKENLNECTIRMCSDSRDSLEGNAWRATRRNNGMWKQSDGELVNSFMLDAAYQAWVERMMTEDPIDPFMVVVLSTVQAFNFQGPELCKPGAYGRILSFDP